MRGGIGIKKGENPAGGVTFQSGPGPKNGLKGKKGGGTGKVMGNPKNVGDLIKDYGERREKKSSEEVHSGKRSGHIVRMGGTRKKKNLEKRETQWRGKRRRKGGTSKVPGKKLNGYQTTTLV